MHVALPCLDRCVAARASGEIIVFDDASGDPNWCFCNWCAASAGGQSDQPRLSAKLQRSRAAGARKYLLLLNNDTQVLPGWLDALVDLLRARPDAGAAGSMLLYPDGRLQEAGGIIWNDGSGWNYGRGDDPERPAYNYVREVDYCSAASLMVRRSVWTRLGGFDEAFVPAYCEDSDLAFRIRADGLNVLYQPRSRVVHLEGVSHGTDIGSGVKRHQLVNQQHFVRRWAESLAREHAAPGCRVLRARDRAMQRPVALVIDHYVPEPDRDAGSCTMMGIIRALIDAGAVVKFWPHNRLRSPGYTDALQEIGVEVLHSGHLETFENGSPGTAPSWTRCCSVGRR